MVTASSICILAEVNAGNLNLESVLKSATIGSAVDLGLTKPESFDEAIKLLSAGHMESVGLFNDIESLLDGIKAEIIAGRIVSEYRFPDIGYGMNFKKSPAYRDVTDGADFELTILDGRFAKELALFDVKKAENSNSQGSCRVVSEGNTAKIYEADFEKPSNIDLYNIEENFIRAIIRNKTSGIVIRLPRGLVTGHSAKELMEMDIDQDLDYNEAKSHIYRELGYVLERVGK